MHTRKSQGYLDGVLRNDPGEDLERKEKSCRQNVYLLGKSTVMD